MNFKAQIKELSDKIKDLEDRSSNLQLESYGLRQKREELIASMIVEDRLMADSEWDLTVDHNSSAHLSYKTGGNMDYIRELAQADYHSWCELSDGINLKFDDSEITLTFKESKMVLPFAKKNGLKISGSTISARLAQLKRDAAALETICHQFNLNKK